MDISLLKRACQKSADAYDQDIGAVVVQVRTAKCIIVEEDDYIFIAVEGTRSNLVDWLKNFWTQQVNHFWLSAHHGCKLEADLLLPGIVANLKRLSRKQLIITGHSQGGGVAPLIAWSLCITHNYQIKAGFGFAPMRSIAKKSIKLFNKHFENRWWSIARQSDIVPHVPPAIRYGNIGRGLFFNKHGQLVKGIPSPFKYMFEIWRLMWRKELPEMWKDHDIEKYLADVQNVKQ